jgi:hypothetical protein
MTANQEHYKRSAFNSPTNELHVTLGGSLVTMAQRVLRLRTEEVVILPWMIQAGGRTLRCEIQKLINKGELPDQCKESITVKIHKKSDKNDCSNYRGILLLSISCKILSNILLSKLSQ